ncbi:MAG: glycosyltransferase [Myxococcales bacterium]
MRTIRFMAASTLHSVPVLHLINQMGIGGAETQFVERLRLHPTGFSAVVGCLDRSGPMLGEMLKLGFDPELYSLKGSLLRANTMLQVGRIAALIRRRGIKIIHGTDINTNLLGLLAARLTGARSIASRVDLGHTRHGFGRMHRALEMWVARNSDMVVANADAVREVCIRVEGCKPARVAVVRNGIDISRFDRLAKEPLQAPLPVPAGATVVAVIGNLWPVKGHRTLVEAVARLGPRFRDVHFVCAGDGPERSFLEQRIAELCLRDRIHLLGHRRDVPAVLARARAACLCSNAEGLSNALMEAMTARLPSVATAVGGTPELIREGENGFLVPPRNPEKLADALGHLLGDLGRARAMGEQGRLRVERELTLEQAAEGLRLVYRRMLNGASVQTLLEPEPARVQSAPAP